MFLGTPHRGSPDLANLGETARSLVSALQMQTSSAILDVLGLKTTDLGRVQESFSALWQKYNFRVKTFQESLGLTGFKISVLGEKVVPDYSSLLGDHRERAETIHANHMDMCRFSGTESPGFRQVAAELSKIYGSFAGVTKQEPWREGNKRRRLSHTAKSESKQKGGSGQRVLSSDEARIVELLWYPTLHSRRFGIPTPVGSTCDWLFEHRLYLDWLYSRNQQESQGLLRLLGKAGAGKSVLMKEAYHRTALETENVVAAFFFDADGGASDPSSERLFRSLLHQLLPKLWQTSSDHQFDTLMRELKAAESHTWVESGCQSIFRQIVLHHIGSRKVFIFIDAIDECSVSMNRDLCNFWRDITSTTHEKGITLNVCLSSRPYPIISVLLSSCPDIPVDTHNYQDIARYTARRLRPAITANEPQWESLKDSIANRAAGIFLWANLVVDDITRKYEEGHGMAYLMSRIDILPAELEELYATSLASIPRQSTDIAMRMFCWAVFAQKPLRVHEWHHIMAFIQQPAPKSLQEWRGSDGFTGTDGQLERKIRSISNGLIEVRTAATGSLPIQDTETDDDSICAGAGSLNLEHGETRVVSVIHESFRRFFLVRGMSILASHQYAYYD
jgi:protein SERAC1